MKHARYLGGSTIERRLNCFGSTWLEAGLNSEPSAAAFRGTALHDLMEEIAFEPNAKSWANTSEGILYNKKDSATGKRHSYLYTKADITEGVLPALDALEKLTGNDPVWYDKEVQVFIDDDIGGTIDLLALDPNGTLYVIDYKFGQIPVSPVKNQALAFYLMCLIESGKLTQDVNKVCFVIIQPTQQDTLNTWWLNKDWFFDVFAPKVRKLVKFVRTLDKERANFSVVDSLSMGSHCQFCKAKKTCPEYSKRKFIGRGQNIQNKTSYTMPISPKGLLDLPNKSKEEMSNLLDWAKDAKELIKHIEDAGLSMLKRGTMVPNWKLVDKRPYRKYSDVGEAEKYLKRKLGAQFAYKTTLISPAQAEKMLGKVSFQRHLAQFVTAESSGVTLKRVETPALESLDLPVNIKL